MSYIVVAPNGAVVLSTTDWRAAVSAAWDCDGRVRTEGRFDDDRVK